MEKGIKSDRFDVENLLNHVLAEKVLSELQIKSICDKVIKLEIIFKGKRDIIKGR